MCVQIESVTREGVGVGSEESGTVRYVRRKSHRVPTVGRSVSVRCKSVLATRAYLSL